jgi:hypothetical protein
MQAFLAAWLLLGAWAAGAARDPPRGTEQLAAIIGYLRKQEENIGSISLVYSAKEVTKFDFADRPSRSERVYRYLASGEKQREERDEPKGGWKGTSPEYVLDTYNGEKHYHFTPFRKTGSVASKSKFPGSYFAFVHPYPGGLAKLLQKYADRITTKGVVVNAERLVCLEWAMDDEQANWKLYLNPAAGYQPRSFSMHGSHPAVGTTVLEAQVLRYVQKAGFFFPAEVVRNVKITKAAQVVYQNDSRFKLISVEPNAPISPKLFEIDFPEGTEVFNADLGLVSVVGRPGSERRIPSAEQYLRLLHQGGLSASSAILWTIFGAGCVAVLLTTVIVIRRKVRKSG